MFFWVDLRPCSPVIKPATAKACFRAHYAESTLASQLWKTAGFFASQQRMKAGMAARILAEGKAAVFVADAAQAP